MKASLFILLIAVGLCCARSKYRFGHPKYWNEVARHEDEPMKDEAAEEATEEEATEEEATEKATEKATEEATEEAKEEATEEGEEKAGVTTATWNFLGNWKEEVQGKLIAGKEVKIVYDGSRLPDRYTMYGQPAWSISVEYKFSEHGEVHSEVLDGPQMIEGVETLTKSIYIPFGTTTLTVWFKHWCYIHSYTYDSNLGENYKEKVSEPAEPTIVFDSSWAETVHGDLEKGGKFNVYYDFKRLDDDDEGLHAVAKFSDNSEDTFTHDLKGRVAASDYLATAYSIPDNAEKVILWFYIVQDGERRYDSNYGQNYVFPVKAESSNEAVGA